MKHDKWLTAEQLKLLEQLSAIRLPQEQMIVMLNAAAPAEVNKVSESTFERMVKTTDSVREAFFGGRSRAAANIRQHAYGMCFDKKIPPQTRHQATKWWTATQEGFKTTSQLEHTGKDGTPLLSADEAEDRLAKMSLRNKSR